MIKPLMLFSFKGFLPQNRYVIFLSGIIIISIIEGIFLSFGFGMSDRDYFLGNSEDTIAIVQPGVKSPIVSYVPSSFIDAPNLIERISNISPVIMSLIIKDNIPITLHGFIKNFLFFEDFNQVSGSNLDSLFSSEENGIVAGKTIAKINLIGFTIEPVFTVETIFWGITIINLVFFSLLISKISKINFIENSIKIFK